MRKVTPTQTHCFHSENQFLEMGHTNWRCIAMSPSKTSYGSGLTIGVAKGIVFRIVFENLALGIALGAGLVMSLSIYLRRR